MIYLEKCDFARHHFQMAQSFKFIVFFTDPAAAQR